MKTLLLALISVEKSKGTREGAIRGLASVGKEAIRKGLVQGGGAKVVGSECTKGDSGPLIDAVMVRRPSSHVHISSQPHGLLQGALRVLQSPSDMPTPLDEQVEGDAAIIVEMRVVLGDFFAEKLMFDAAWAKGILNGDVQS
jgi:transcription initiation factor TFIID subunit 6